MLGDAGVLLRHPVDGIVVEGEGGWSAIVPDTFAHLFDSPDVMLLDLVEPSHSQAIGIVFSARDPLSPMASALLHASKGIEVPGALQGRH